MTIRFDHTARDILSIADDGIGMRAATSGAGLGIARALAAQLDLEMRIDSGEGTKVTFARRAPAACGHVH